MIIRNRTHGVGLAIWAASLLGLAYWAWYAANDPLGALLAPAYSVFFVPWVLLYYIAQTLRNTPDLDAKELLAQGGDGVPVVSAGTIHAAVSGEGGGYIYQRMRRQSDLPLWTVSELTYGDWTDGGGDWTALLDEDRCKGAG